MSNDRELLELAAKAAGLSVGWSISANTMFINGQFDDELWNPLTDDGDALRLAVKLHLFEYGRFMELRLEDTRDNPTRDDYTIARRAIVRAAAEIGKGMK